RAGSRARRGDGHGRSRRHHAAGRRGPAAGAESGNADATAVSRAAGAAEQRRWGWGTGLAIRQARLENANDLLQRVVDAVAVLVDHRQEAERSPDLRGHEPHDKSDAAQCEDHSFNVSAMRILMNACRLTPRLAAARSIRSSKARGKSTFTRCTSRPGRRADAVSRYGVRSPSGWSTGRSANRSNSAAVRVGVVGRAFFRAGAARRDDADRVMAIR